MNFTTLYYFQVAAQELNLTRAAQKLYISQQALSGHINRLEKECGTPLFERSPKLRLTYAGECVLEYADTFLSTERQMNGQLSDIINNRGGKLSLGVYIHRSQIFLTRTLPEFMHLYPHVKIEIVTGLSRELEQSLIQGNLDLMVGFTPFSNPNLECATLSKERLCLLVPRNLFEQNFINSRAVLSHFHDYGVDLGAFKDFPFLALGYENRAQTLAEQLFRSADFNPNFLFQVSDSQTMMALCQAGIGCAFVFHQAAIDFFKQNQSGNNLLVFPIQKPIALTELVIAWHKHRYLANTSKNFIRLSKEAFQNSCPVEDETDAFSYNGLTFNTGITLP